MDEKTLPKSRLLDWLRRQYEPHIMLSLGNLFAVTFESQHTLLTVQLTREGAAVEKEG